jgi:hypothetical protein
VTALDSTLIVTSVAYAGTTLTVNYSNGTSFTYTPVVEDFYDALIAEDVLDDNVFKALGQSGVTVTQIA